MMFLAGAAASGALDLISSLTRTVDSHAAKGGQGGATFAAAADGAAFGSAPFAAPAPALPVAPTTMRAMLALQAQDGDTSPAVFSNLDTDGDGAVSADELAAAMKPTGRSRDEEEVGTADRRDERNSTVTRPAAPAPGADPYAGAHLERLIERQTAMLATSSAGRSMAVTA